MNLHVEWIDGREQLPADGQYVWLVKRGFDYCTGGNPAVHKCFFPVKAFIRSGVWFEEYCQLSTGDRVTEAIDPAKLPEIWWCPIDQPTSPVPEHLYSEN